MKKFMIAVMLVVGFVGFSPVSEAGPLRNLIRNLRGEGCSCQSSCSQTQATCCGGSQVVSQPATSGCSSCQNGACNYPTPIRNVAGQVVGGVVNYFTPTCKNGNCLNR